MSQGEALAEGFYWYAEKLMWGYEDTTKNLQEALRLYRQGWIIDGFMHPPHPRTSPTLPNK